MWLFDSYEEADSHPIVQYGDVICRGPEHIRTQYNRLELPDLLRRLGDESFRKEVLVKMGGPEGREAVLGRYQNSIWSRMCAAASRPPESAEETVAIVVRDRKLSRTEGRQTKERDMNDTTEAPAKEKKAKAPKEDKVKTIGGYNLGDKITLLCDKEGKPYGPDNNPKRPGSATSTRFALYKNGMTVEEAITLGVQSGDLIYDVGKMFIKIDPA